MVWSPTKGKMITNGDISAHLRVLGSMEQQALYNAVNLDLPILNDTLGEAANFTAAMTRLTVFLCPSAPWPSYTGTGLAAGAYQNLQVTGNSYSASMGSSLEYDASMTGGPPNGLFYYSGVSRAAPVRLAAVTDGLSNTIAFGEWKLGTGNLSTVSLPQDVIFAGIGPFTQNTPSVTMSIANEPMLMQWLGTCASSVTTARFPRTMTLGQYWAVGLPVLTLGNVILAPNPKYPNCGFLNSYNSGGMFTLSSYHPGGCNIVLGDGSVRFLKDSTSLQTVWALGSRAQGEVISADSY